MIAAIPKRQAATFTLMMILTCRRVFILKSLANQWLRPAAALATHGTAQSQSPLYLRRAIATVGAIGSGPEGVAWFASPPGGPAVRTLKGRIVDALLRLALQLHAGAEIRHRRMMTPSGARPGRLRARVRSGSKATRLFFRSFVSPALVASIQASSSRLTECCWTCWRRLPGRTTGPPSCVPSWSRAVIP